MRSISWPRHQAATWFLSLSFFLTGIGPSLFARDFDSQPTQRQPVVVETEKGRLSGLASTNYPSIYAFKGIPFAAPPIGSRRWRVPQPVEPWSGIKAADTFGKACVQEAAPFAVLEVGEQSEDCLTLNVWTPQSALTRQTAPLPVLVFIHGGSYTTGAGHLYQGEALATEGIVVVSFNYRLGIFGFLTHSDLAAESATAAMGNYALYDQLAVLTWVRRNIAAFGGDPAQVTLTGQSSGANSVGLLMAAPMARGLFQQAIIQSGAIPGASLSRAAAVRRGDKLAEELGCHFATGALACMRGVSARQILRASTGFGPFVDGTLITGDPEAQFAAGDFARVPTLIGQTKDEGNMFVSRVPIFGATAYRLVLKRMFGDFSERVFAAFPASIFSNVTATLGRVASAAYYTAPIRQLQRALQRAEAAPVFHYEFSRLSDHAATYNMGVFHGLDLFYLFDWITGRTGFSATDVALARSLRAAFAAFVKTGQPGHAQLPEAWQPYTDSSSNYFEFGDRLHAGRDLCVTRRAACDLFDEWAAAEAESRTANQL